MVQCSLVVAPALYPQEVKVVSKDSSSVVVSWRGVSTGQSEDSLKGYVVSTYLLCPWLDNEQYFKHVGSIL